MAGQLPIKFQEHLQVKKNFILDFNYRILI
jgi:hypothetical protein